MIQSYQKPLGGDKIGIVFGSFAPLHTGHIEMIMRAKKENNGGCVVIVCGRDGDKGEPVIPFYKRYKHVREFFSDDDLVAVYGINENDDDIPDYPNGWEAWMEAFYKIWDIAIDHATSKQPVWYVGDKEYYDGLTERNEKVILLDRKINPISGTIIREKPLSHWFDIAAPFRVDFSHNILITGTASEGKTTLVQDLSKWYSTTFSTEYARQYMIENNLEEWELGVEDYLAFLYGQYRMNQDLIKSKSNKGFFFSDTDSLVTRMYAEYYSNDINLKLSKRDLERISDLAYLYDSKSRWNKIFVIAPSGVFVDDHTRYMGHSGMDSRQEMFGILMDSIEKSGNAEKVTVLNGGYYNNFETIKEYVKGVLKNENN